MLRIIFCDIHPYIVDGKVLNECTWECLSKNHILDKYANQDNNLLPFFMAKKSLFEFQSEYLKKINGVTYKSIVQEWNKVYQSFLQDYLQKNINPNILNLVEDAKKDNIEIIFYTNNNNFASSCEMFKKYFKNNNFKLLKLNDFEILKTDFLIEYCSKLGITYDQIAVITQNEETIDDLVNNNIFTLTISADEEIIEDNFVSFDSFDNLSIKQILYYYSTYEKSDINNI